MKMRYKPIPAALARKIDRIFSRWDSSATPGVALAVIREGEYLYKRCYGMADLEHDIPIDTSTVFDMASITKQFTATCVAILSQQGRLSLDDEITRYLPEMPRYNPPVTIRHLLNHTGGLRNMYLTMVLKGHGEGIAQFDWGDTTLPFPQEYRVLCRQKAGDFRAGDKWDYSNMGYHLLALIVERVSGTSFRKFADRQIFRPLGMGHSHMHDDRDELVPGRARAYMARKSGGFAIWEQPSGDPGASELFTTLDDMILWHRNWVRNRLGRPGLHEIMLTPAILNDGTVQGYGMGLMQFTRRGSQVIGHYGWYLGFVSVFVHYPEHGFSVICLKNVAGEGEWGIPSVEVEKITDLCLADVLRDAPGQKPPKPAPPAAFIRLEPGKLAHFAGRYRAPGGGGCRIFSGGTTLVMGGNWEGLVEMNPIGNNLFLVHGKNPEERIQFLGGKSGRPCRLRWYSGGKLIWELVRKGAQPSAPRRNNPRLYAGRYYSDEMETTLEIAAKGKHLEIRGIGHTRPPWEALHIEGDTFQSGRLRLVFNRDKRGKVAGFDLLFNFTRLRWARISGSA
jgi:CubicO group peptidase (beta-lactamase class C family)